MNAMEMAAELGRMIKEDARVKRLEAATEAYEKDAELQTLVVEYNAQSMALTEEYKKPEKDKEVIAAIENRINVIYEAIAKNPVLLEYNEATEAVNAYMTEINGEITYQITGQRPCAHNCSDCHSACGHSHA